MVCEIEPSFSSHNLSAELDEYCGKKLEKTKFFPKLKELYERKHYLYETEKLVDKQIGEEFSHCVLHPKLSTTIQGVFCISFMVTTNPYYSTSSQGEKPVYELFYFFDQNMNSVRYPIVTRSGSEVIIKAFPIIYTTSTVVDIETLESGLMKYTNPITCCEDCIIKSWYIIQEGVFNIIKQIGIQYWTKHGQLILEEKINEDNRLVTETEFSSKKTRIGYKAALSKDGKECIVKLGILEDTLLASAPGEDKVRCNKALVLDIETFERVTDGIKITGQIQEAYSFIACNNFLYRIGEISQVSDFNGNLRLICVPGIHFYWMRFRCLQYFGIYKDLLNDLPTESS
jgi:hypothetical protein